MPPRSRTPTSVGSPRLGCSLPCLTRSPRSGRGSPLSSCDPCRLQPRGTEPQRRHPDQRQTGSTAPDCHRPIRTIWVYKGTPNPPVEPSVVLNGRIVFSFLGLDVECALNGKVMSRWTSFGSAHSLFEPCRLGLSISAEGGEETHTTDEESAGGTHETPRFQVPKEESICEICREVEVHRGHDDEQPDRHRRPDTEDRSDPLDVHRLIKRMIASAGSPPHSSRALRASASETPAFSATSWTSSSGIAGPWLASGFFASARSRTIGSPTTVQIF